MSWDDFDDFFYNLLNSHYNEFINCEHCDILVVMPTFIEANKCCILLSQLKHNKLFTAATKVDLKYVCWGALNSYTFVQQFFTFREKKRMVGDHETCSHKDYEIYDLDAVFRIPPKDDRDYMLRNHIEPCIPIVDYLATDHRCNVVNLSAIMFVFVLFSFFFIQTHYHLGQKPNKTTEVLLSANILLMFLKVIV